MLRTPFIRSNFGPIRRLHLRSGLLIGPKLDFIKGVRSKIRLYMRTFSIIPDPKHKIYQKAENNCLGWGSEFSPTLIYMLLDRRKSICWMKMCWVDQGQSEGRSIFMNQSEGKCSIVRIVNFNICFVSDSS